MNAEPPATGPRSRVEVGGEIDIAVVSQLRSRLIAEQAETVELDLAAVTFIDSSGLAGLLDAKAALAESGQTLELVNRPRAVVRLLQITGLTNHFGPGEATD
jgi:anti-anti-sigma factor